MKPGHFEHQNVLNVGTSQILGAQSRDTYLKSTQILPNPKLPNLNVSALHHFRYGYPIGKSCNLEMLGQESPNNNKDRKCSPSPFLSIDNIQVKHQTWHLPQYRCPHSASFRTPVTLLLSRPACTNQYGSEYLDFLPFLGRVKIL